ncbi:MAG: HNH endonuclease [Ruminococcaceae bacterium]|nr:HNH endonuclease [Oscillospiraceae bacterium]
MTKHIYKRKHMPHNEVVARLLERDGNQCSICGVELQHSNCTIEHILPVCYGGSDELSNLQLCCCDCNHIKTNKPFLGYQFEEYIKRLLEANRNYSNISSNIKIDGKTIDCDIVFEKETLQGKEMFFAEVSVVHSFTENLVINKVKRLLEYKQKVPKANLVFITPNDLSEKYEDLIRSNNIELWDKSFLSKEFAEQIIDAEPTSFKLFFSLSSGKVMKGIDEHQKLICNLKNCASGWDNWVNYQKLVGSILEFLFCPPLNSPIAQSDDKSKKNRRDFILENYSKENDIWEFLRDRYSADYVVVDAKNSMKSISKDDVLQIANYLKKEGTGLFGLIIARKGTNAASENALREMWIYQQKMIVVLNDVDIEQMILDKKNGDDPAKLILKKITDFRLLI